MGVCDNPGIKVNSQKNVDSIKNVDKEISFDSFDSGIYKVRNWKSLNYYSVQYIKIYNFINRNV